MPSVDREKILTFLDRSLFITGVGSEEKRLGKHNFANKQNTCKQKHANKTPQGCVKQTFIVISKVGLVQKLKTKKAMSTNIYQSLSRGAINMTLYSAGSCGKGHCLQHP